jgi:S1-C subfamily serine protease
MRLPRLIGLITALVLTARAIDSTDFSEIDKKNRNSIIFIKTIKERKDGTGKPVETSGTGFVIEESGYVLTNSHVIPATDSDTTVRISGAERSRYNFSYPLTLITRDEGIDIALLQFPDVKQWRPVQIGDPKQVPPSGNLLTLGFPGDLDLSAATGIVSNKQSGGRWQTTLPLNYGNSGSPVFDSSGKVVAIAVGGRDDLNQVTYAIPINYGRPMLEIVQKASISATAEPVELKQTFTFYASVDHEEEQHAAQEFCLPAGYEVQSSIPRETTKNGSETKLESVIKTPARPNCVTVKAFVKGNGVRKVGPVVVDHLGRGWLGEEINVVGKRVNQ